VLYATISFGYFIWHLLENPSFRFLGCSSYYPRDTKVLLQTPHLCTRDFERKGGHKHPRSNICSDCVLLISLCFSFGFSSLSNLLFNFVRIVDFLSWGLFWGLSWGEIQHLDYCNHLVWAVYGCDLIWTHFENPNKTQKSSMHFLICNWFTNSFDFTFCGNLGNSFVKVCAKFQFNWSSFRLVSHSKTKIRAAEKQH
jgi:hypothetical protein